VSSGVGENFERLGFVVRRGGDDLGGSLNFWRASRVMMGVAGVEFLGGEPEFVVV
jgi:hypothetical protein